MNIRSFYLLALCLMLSNLKAEAQGFKLWDYLESPYFQQKVKPLMQPIISNPAMEKQKVDEVLNLTREAVTTEAMANKMPISFLLAQLVYLSAYGQHTPSGKGNNYTGEYTAQKEANSLVIETKVTVNGKDSSVTYNFKAYASPSENVRAFAALMRGINFMPCQRMLPSEPEGFCQCVQRLGWGTPAYMDEIGKIMVRNRLTQYDMPDPRLMAPSTRGADPNAPRDPRAPALPVDPRAMRDPQNDPRRAGMQFSQNLVETLRQVATETGIPAGVLAATAIHITQNGASPAATTSHSCFHLLADKSWKGDTAQVIINNEKTILRKYATQADAIKDFAALLNAHPVLKKEKAARTLTELDWLYLMEQNLFAAIPDFAEKTYNILLQNPFVSSLNPNRGERDPMGGIRPGEAPKPFLLMGIDGVKVPAEAEKTKSKE